MGKRQFKAESKRLMELMINSIYTHQEIFLRELISNASDAIDKLAYLSLTDDQVGLNRFDFSIDIKVDKEYRLLTISDNGIGMSADEMVTNLGTIAKSGSRQFKEDMTETEAVDIIGQFGVGFYAAFMVAESVSVVSRKYGEDQAHLWQSSGVDGYTISECERDAAGTDVVLRLKQDDAERYSRFLEGYQIRQLVKKYSDFVRYPIRLEVQRTREVEDPNDAEKKISENYTEWETLNSMVPVWQHNSSELSEDDYNNFYRDKYMDPETPTLHIHMNAEGLVSFRALLYVPGRLPFDYYTKDYKAGLQLYSSGVMIMDNCTDLLPDYFRFVKGIVDSQDLSLNISREMLQHDRQLRTIRNMLEKRVKSELVKLQSADRDKYEQFFAAFGRQLKYGLVSEYGAHKEMLQDLILLRSARQGRMITLREYVEEMPEEQKHIYYASGENISRMEHLPQSELVLEKGFDLLLCTDEVDEFALQIMVKYDEKEFRNVSTDDLELASVEQIEKLAEKIEASRDVLEFIKQSLDGKVSDVRLGSDLGRHLACMRPESGMSFEMEKYFQRTTPDKRPHIGRILELNADHELFDVIAAAVEKDRYRADKYAQLVYYLAMLMAELPLDDPSAYTDLVCELIK